VITGISSFLPGERLLPLPIFMAKIDFKCQRPQKNKIVYSIIKSPCSYKKTNNKLRFKTTRQILASVFVNEGRKKP
jgi:hypothetical protein